MFPVCRRQVEPHAQIPRCVDGIGEETVKSDRSAEVLHHFGLGRTIGFQAAVSDTSDGKHPEFSHVQLIVGSRCLRRIVTQTKQLVLLLLYENVGARCAMNWFSVVPPPHTATAGLLLWARRAGERYRSISARGGRMYIAEPR